MLPAGLLSTSLTHESIIFNTNLQNVVSIMYFNSACMLCVSKCILCIVDLKEMYFFLNQFKALHLIITIML